jgi:hypothetical protein
MSQDAPQRKLVVSFHDLHPGSMECCIRFLQRLERVGVHQASLLAVPYWYGREPIVDHPAFCAWLRNVPHDISLHGWTHRAVHRHGKPLEWVMANHYTAGEGEFYRLPDCEAEYLVARGLEMFQSVGIRARGFIAPAWLMEQSFLPVLGRVGLEYAVTLSRIHEIQRGSSLRAPVLCTTSRTQLRRALTRPVVSMLAGMHAREPLLRIAVHPVDFRYPDIEELIFRLIVNALKTRTPTTYRDLVSH